jgi:hypothetical protein
MFQSSKHKAQYLRCLLTPDRLLKLLPELGLVRVDSQHQNWQAHTSSKETSSGSFPYSDSLTDTKFRENNLDQFNTAQL